MKSNINDNIDKIIANISVWHEEYKKQSKEARRNFMMPLEEIIDFVNMVPSFAKKDISYLISELQKNGSGEYFFRSCFRLTNPFYDESRILDPYYPDDYNEKFANSYREIFITLFEKFCPDNEKGKIRENFGITSSAEELAKQEKEKLEKEHGASFSEKELAKREKEGLGGPGMGGSGMGL